MVIRAIVVVHHSLTCGCLFSGERDFSFIEREREREREREKEREREREREIFDQNFYIEKSMVEMDADFDDWLKEEVDTSELFDGRRDGHDVR